MENAAATATSFSPEQVTRMLFEDFAPSAIHLFYIVGFAAIIAFCHGAYVPLRKYRRGGGDAAVVTHLAKRFTAMLGTVASHRTIRCRDAPAGRAHGLIFLGFVLLFVGTAVITLEYDLTARLFGFKFWYGDFYLWFSLVLDLAGLGLIAGLLYMKARRGWIRPPKLKSRP